MLLRFTAVGLIGFIVDAGVLSFLVTAGGWHHYVARGVSFPLAVTVTWLANRTWVFRKTGRVRREYLGYFAVQITGALINLGTYVAVIETWPGLATTPVIPLAVGAALGLVFNFLASRRFVFAQVEPMPGLSDVGSPTSSYSGRENLEAMKFARNYNDFLVGLVARHASGERVLDFGAGAGTFAKPLADLGYAVHCIEPDAELQETLRAQGLVTDASLDSVEPGSMDYIYSLNVLEHIDDDAAAIDSICTRLAPGGCLMLYVPAFACLYSAMDRRVGHFRRYRRDQLRRLVEDGGLVVEQIRYLDSIGFFASLAYKYFGSDSGTITGSSVRLYDRVVFPVSRLCDLFLGAVLGKNLVVVARKAVDEPVPAYDAGR